MKCFQLTSLLLVCVLGAPVLGQQPDDEAMKRWMAFMQPGDNHQLLARRVGTWDVVVKMWMDPSQPPEESTATAEISMILGGRYQQEKVNGQFNGMPFEGLGTTGFNNATKQFFSTWIDNMGTGMMQAHGTYNEDKKRFEYETSGTDPMSGEATEGRSYERLVDADTMIAEAYRKGPDGKYFKEMELHYKRAK